METFRRRPRSVYSAKVSPMSRASLAAAFVAAVAVLRSPEAAAFGVDKLHLRRQASHGAARDFLNFPARVRPVSGSSLDDSDSDDDKSVFEDVQAMTVKEIKAELKSIGIRSDDVFEKIDIVRRLVKARSGESAGSASKGSPVTSSTASPSATSTRAGQPSSRSRDGAVSVPLSFYSLENFRTIDASNAAPVYVRPSPGQFASIKAELPSKGKSLTLLVDTACSGLVLRPSSVERLGIVTSNARGSMTSAGGRSGNIEVAQVESFLVGGSRFGALTAAVQDIGALPSPLDGIIGLAFLGQFATVDFDFAASKLDLYQQDSSPQVPRSLGKVATAQMAMTGLGIYTVDVLLDGRGPVKMLADTGAASTILNWKGLSDMGLDQNSSPEVTKNREDMGAIGADNVALCLTHRYILNNGFDLVNRELNSSSSSGVYLRNAERVKIDIGTIPVLDVLGAEGVGGILGGDLLMQADVLRINFKGRHAGKVTLYSPAANEIDNSAASVESRSARQSPPRKKKKKIRSN